MWVRGFLRLLLCLLVWENTNSLCGTWSHKAGTLQMHVQDTDVQRRSIWDASHFRLGSLLCSAGWLSHVWFWVSLRFLQPCLIFWFYLHHRALSPEMIFLLMCESLWKVQYQCLISWRCWGWPRAWFVLSQWQGEDLLRRPSLLCLLQTHMGHSGVPLFNWDLCPYPNKQSWLRFTVKSSSPNSAWNFFSFYCPFSICSVSVFKVMVASFVNYQ